MTEEQYAQLLDGTALILPNRAKTVLSVVRLSQTRIPRSRIHRARPILT